MANRKVTTIPATISKYTATPINSRKKRRVAGYARVSTDHEDQQTSYAAQVDYYTNYIKSREDWEYAGLYTDEGISGTNTKRREGFKRMIADAKAGKINLIITKSVSRFARNTVDSLTTVRELKDMGIEIYFEKENIWTLDSKGELLITIMSSLAQEESRSISENVTWGQRKRMADGKVSFAYSRFLGLDKDKETGKIVVNPEQAKTVKLIFRLFLEGKTPHAIAMYLTKQGIKTPGGKDVWNSNTVRRMLSNEKYKGDALLQKEFTVDFLQKKLKKNEGEFPQYYVEGNHEAIISPWLFDYVQKCIEDRRNLPRRYSGATGLSSKIECGICGSMYTPRPWHSTSYNYLVWQCRNGFKTGSKCQAHNIHDRLLHYIIHDAARIVALQRNVPQTVADILITIVGADRADDIWQWVHNFQKKNAWRMLSDEKELALILQRITVMPNRQLRITWLDGKQYSYRLPQYYPSQRIEEYDDK